MSKKSTTTTATAAATTTAIARLDTEVSRLAAAFLAAHSVAAGYSPFYAERLAKAVANFVEFCSRSGVTTLRAACRPALLSAYVAYVESLDIPASAKVKSIGRVRRFLAAAVRATAHR